MKNGSGGFYRRHREEQRAAIWIGRVNFCFRPGVEVCNGSLEEGRARGGHGELIVQFVRLFFADGIGEAEEVLLSINHV